jgi:hypothetical protein
MMKAIIKHLEETCRIGDVERVYGQFMILYPGFRVFQMLMTVPELKQKYSKAGVSDLREH